MISYCTLVKAGTASVDQETQCCGSVECTIALYPACTEQTQWSSTDPGSTAVTHHMGQGTFSYNTAATASNGNQYTAGYFATARRCEQCATPCINSGYYNHYWCYTDTVKKIYGDCIPDQETVSYCATLDGTGLYHPTLTLSFLDSC